MWLRWFPWKLIVRRAAKAHGFLDPIAVLSYARRFSQPSQIAEPIELLRAGVVFHARGLMNSRAIQQNLDWVWPYWVNRQFDPASDSFIPRAFSITHVNLTHRNWTAVGIAGSSGYAIVDPRGLVMPYWDSWSLDAWVIADDGQYLVPARLKDARQELICQDGLAVRTASQAGGLSLTCQTDMQYIEGARTAVTHVTAKSEKPAWLVISARPYNPEGVSFINKLHLGDDRTCWCINGDYDVTFSEPAQKHSASEYYGGDVFLNLPKANEKTQVTCKVGMATAAAMFRIEGDLEKSVTFSTKRSKLKSGKEVWTPAKQLWKQSLQGRCRLDIPDQKMKFLYDAALRVLVLHSPHEVYPGPFTYKRFWFRDAAYIIYGLLCAGLTDQAQRAIATFPSRQLPTGYLRSQDGEWDSNGQAIWIMDKYCKMSNSKFEMTWVDTIQNAARWIVNKRTPKELNAIHAGLLPAGFSAEHLGPNDYYYWDDFWSVTGLQCASHVMNVSGRHKHARLFAIQADDLLATIEKTLEHTSNRLGRPAIAASPYRRLDSGAIGSIVAGYPLQIWDMNNKRLADTIEYLLENCFVKGGFFQDMIHSGINAYLTLQIAQILMQSGDQRFADLVKTVAQLASPTGQWPEAIHPKTLEGCMGDGQHVWAAAEWVLMMRNSFVFEDEQTSSVVIGAGILDDWLVPGKTLRFGPAPTVFGPIDIWMDIQESKIEVHWDAKWFSVHPQIRVSLPKRETIVSGLINGHVTVESTRTS